MCSSLPWAGHDGGHRVLEDAVLGLKERKRGVHAAPAMGVRQRRKEGRWGSEAGETRLFLEAHPLVKAARVQEAMGVRPSFLHR